MFQGLIFCPLGHPRFSSALQHSLSLLYSLAAASHSRCASSPPTHSLSLLLPKLGTGRSLLRREGEKGGGRGGMADEFKGLSRLPGFVVPRRNDLRLKPDLSTCKFDGFVEIDVEILQETWNIVINAAFSDMILSSAVKKVSPTVLTYTTKLWHEFVKSV